MMSARLLKRFACCSALIVLFASVGTSHAAPDDPEPKSHVIQAADKDQYEITSTDQGATYAQDAVNRWAKEHGIHTPVSDVKVYNMGTPTSPVTLVIPKQLIFKEMSIVTNPDGTIKTAVKTEMLANQFPSIASNPSDTDIAPQQSRETYELAVGGCADTIQGQNGYMTQCYRIYKVVNEIDAGRDYFLLDHYATATPTNNRYLRRVRIEASQNTGSPAMGLVDWNPRSPISGNCEQVDFGISMGGASIGIPRKVCENWVPTQFSGAHIAVEWTPTFWTNVFEARDIGLTELISVEQEKFPSWFFWAEFVA
jgi:hypothetical protein